MHRRGQGSSARFQPWELHLWASSPQQMFFSAEFLPIKLFSIFHRVGGGFCLGLVFILICLFVIWVFEGFLWCFFGFFPVFSSPPVNLDFHEYPSIVLPRPPPATSRTWGIHEKHPALKNGRNGELPSKKWQKLGIPALRNGRNWELPSKKQENEELLLWVAAGVGSSYNHPEQLALWSLFPATSGSLRQFHQN